MGGGGVASGIGCRTTVSPAAMPGLVQNIAYTTSITSSGGSGTVTYSVSSGSLPTGLTLQSESMAHDPHASVDLAAERLTKRLKRHKQRIRDHHSGVRGSARGRLYFPVGLPNRHQ